MKLTKTIIGLAATLIATIAPAFADTLPESGTYFIINNGSGEALQPVGPTVAQNVLLYPANKSGMQKWTITRLLDVHTKKPTNRYEIRLAGENGELYFQPHDIAERTALILPDKSVMVIDAKESGLVVKSVKRNGDALYAYASPPSYAEARWGASDDSAKYLWTFEPAN